MTAEVCLLGRPICYLHQTDKSTIPFNNRHSNLETYNIHKNRKKANFLFYRYYIGKLFLFLYILYNILTFSMNIQLNINLDCYPVNLYTLKPSKI